MIMGQVCMIILMNYCMIDFRDTLEETSRVQEGLNEEAKKFYRLVEEGKQELFPGCKNFSKLSFMIRLLLYKTLHGLSNVAFDDLLQLLKEMIPEAKLPANFTQAKNIVRDLGLDYKKIPACPNDCMLYWKEYEHVDVCHICHTSKWKQMKEKQGIKCNNEPSKKTSKVPAKVVWHFPLKHRLQRLFMCSKTAFISLSFSVITFIEERPPSNVKRSNSRANLSSFLNWSSAVFVKISGGKFL